MTEKKEWHFSDAGMGPYDGFNNAAVDHFRNDNSIFREVIQNSLDNRDESGEAVIVKFETKNINSSDLGINNQFKTILKSAEKWTQNADKDDIKNFYENANEAILKKEIPVFIISDFNTVGLYRYPTDPNSNYYRLILNPGASKQSSDGGGSHGHGQHATYARSRLRTVLFQSYVENMIEDTDHKRLFIGKTILNSWENEDNKKMRGTGFYGNLVDNEILPAFDNDVPKQIKGLRSSTGTDVIITEPLLKPKWQMTARSQIVQHFFAAIEEKKLIAQLAYSDKKINKMDHLTLDDDIRKTNNRTTKNYLDALRQLDEDYIFTKELGDLGKVIIKIAMHDKGNQKIMMLRRPRMRIVEYSKPILPNYSGVIIIDDPIGNKIIRNLEDPEHKKLESSREEELYPNKSYLKSIEDFIDETLNHLNEQRVDNDINLGLGNILPSEENKTSDGSNDSDSNEMDTFQNAEQLEIDFSGKIHQNKPTLSNLIILGGTGNKGGGGGNRRKSRRKGGRGGGGKSGGDDGEGMSILNSVTMRSFLSGRDGKGSKYRIVLRAHEDCEGYLGLKAVGVDSTTMNPEISDAEMILNGRSEKLKILESYKLNIGSLKKGQKAIINFGTRMKISSTIIGCN